MEFISIVPNIKNSIALDEEIINLISSAEENISRIVIQDNNGYGVCLPASINKAPLSFVVILKRNSPETFMRTSPI